MLYIVCPDKDDVDTYPRSPRPPFLPIQQLSESPLIHITRAAIRLGRAGFTSEAALVDTYQRTADALGSPNFMHRSPRC